MNFETSKHRDFYFEYHRIGSNAFRDKVKYYEDNKKHIDQLPYEERIDVELDHVICLFEIGKYHKFLSKIDSIIEIVIIDNIFNYNGVNIYNDLLFKKAACLFNTGQYIKAQKILKSSIKLDPENNIARLLYSKCKRKQARAWHDTVKTIAIVMIISGTLIASILIISELFASKSLLSNYTSILNGIKNFMFIFGGISLIANELYLQYIIGREIGFKFQLKIPKRKEPDHTK